MVRADAMRCEVDALAIGLTLEHYKAQAHGQAVEEGWRTWISMGTPTKRTGIS